MRLKLTFEEEVGLLSLESHSYLDHPQRNTVGLLSEWELGMGVEEVGLLRTSR